MRTSSVSDENDSSSWSTTSEEAAGSDDELDPEICQILDGTTNARALLPKYLDFNPNKKCLYLIKEQEGFTAFQ